MAKKYHPLLFLHKCTDRIAKIGNRILLFWQKCIDGIAKIVDVIACCVLNILAVEVRLEECHQRKAVSEKEENNFINFETAQDKEGILHYCESIFSESKNRHSYIADKAKVLLTIGTFSSGLIIGLLSYARENKFPHLWLFILPALFALISFFLILFYYGMGKYQTPALSNDDIKASAEDLKIKRAQTMWSVANDLDRVSDFLGNVYIGARRSLIFSWVLLVGLAIYGAFR